MVVDGGRQGELVRHRLRQALCSLGFATLVAGCSHPSQETAAATAGGHAPSAVRLEAALATAVVPDDPDDPAIWVHPTDPSRSLILGTNKVAAPNGAVVVFGLDGRVRQTIGNIDRPNNIDVEPAVRLGSGTVDLVVTTERLKHRLRAFRIDPEDERLHELGSVPVLEGEVGERGEPMGIALYRRASDGRVFAIVAPKLGSATNYLWQYALGIDAAGTLTGTLVRRFGAFSGIGAEPGEAGEIEAVVVDDELGYVYYSDERFGIRKWHADPDHVDRDKELAVFGRSGYEADREGLAIYQEAGGGGYLISVDQIEGGSVLKAYRRAGEPGAPHDHSKVVFDVKTAADATDGIEATSRAFPRWPAGVVVMMNSGPKNFLVFDWRTLSRVGP